MNIPLYLNTVLCSIVLYCVIVRVNLLHGPGNLIQRASMIFIAIGMCWDGFGPWVYWQPVDWGDLFLPLGLTLFFVRYVRRVEEFFQREQA